MRISNLPVLLLLWLSSSLCADTLTFRNFGQVIQLVPQQNHFVVAGTGQAVQITNRLIVKVAHAIDHSALMSRHDAITQASLLFESKSFRFFAVELASGADMVPTLTALSQQNDILLVQPDLLQLTRRAHAEKVSDNEVDILPPQQRAQLWQQSRGGGVKVAIIDDGFDLTHPALANVKLAFSYDIETRTLAAAPLSPQDQHGTRVAGILFAAAQPGKTQGLAPDAELIAIRQPDSWTSNTLLAFHLAALAGADVINCSWTTPLLLQPIESAVRALAQEGRKGKGTAVIFAAGNEGRTLAERDTEAAIADAIVVAAVDAHEKPLPSSNVGSSVDITAFGESIDSTAVSDRYAPLAGTSLASAVVSGMAALVLGAEPELDLPALLNRLKTLRTQAVLSHARPDQSGALHAGR